MIIRPINLDEVDYAIVPCVGPEDFQTNREAVEARRRWLIQAMAKGTQVLVALKRGNFTEGRTAVGLVEVSPIEVAPHPVQGEGVGFIDCIWVIPPFWRRGIGRRLMEEALKRGDYPGLAVIAYEGDQWWGFFDYMPAWFFRKFGFKEVDREGSRVLLYRGSGEVSLPRLIRARYRFSPIKGKIVIDVFWSGQCPAGLMWLLKEVRDGITAYPNVVLRVFETTDRKAVERHGLSYGAYVNGRLIRNGMVSWKEIEFLLKEAMRRSKPHG